MLLIKAMFLIYLVLVAFMFIYIALTEKNPYDRKHKLVMIAIFSAVILFFMLAVVGLGYWAQNNLYMDR